jgi:hypothetical protein
MSESNDLERSREREIAERARRLFAESVRGLDRQTRAGLAEARAKAVEAAGSRGFSWLQPSSLVPVGAVAAAALMVAVIWQSPESTLGLSQPTALGDLDILLEGEGFDLFEDLEFYAWLLEQPELMEGDESADGSG